MRISDWSSDVCSSDLQEAAAEVLLGDRAAVMVDEREGTADILLEPKGMLLACCVVGQGGVDKMAARRQRATQQGDEADQHDEGARSLHATPTPLRTRGGPATPQTQPASGPHPPNSPQ